MKSEVGLVHTLKLPKKAFFFIFLVMLVCHKAGFLEGEKIFSSVCWFLISNF